MATVKKGAERVIESAITMPSKPAAALLDNLLRKKSGLEQCSQKSPEMMASLNAPQLVTEAPFYP